MANANLEFPTAFEADDLKAGEEVLLLLGRKMMELQIRGRV